MTVRFRDGRIDWLGYACARIAMPEAPIVYTDPGRYGTLEGTWATEYGGYPHPSGPDCAPNDGDVIVVTHDHHYDSDGVRRVANDDATVLVHEAVDADRIGENGREVESPEELPYDIRRVREGETHEIDGATVKVIPAYNLADGPNVDADGSPLHPEGMGGGFVIAVDGVSACWPGDSDVLDVHRELSVDVLLPSISSSYTMDRHDAAALAEAIDPALVMPIHYNTFDALSADSRAFAADVAGQSIPVALDERGVLGA